MRGIPVPPGLLEKQNDSAGTWDTLVRARYGLVLQPFLGVI